MKIITAKVSLTNLVLALACACLATVALVRRAEAHLGPVGTQVGGLQNGIGDVVGGNVKPGHWVVLNTIDGPLFKPGTAMAYADKEITTGNPDQIIPIPELHQIALHFR